MRIFTILCLLLTAGGLFAQAPSGFKFQAVARDIANEAMANENIAVRVSLVQGSASGVVAYAERHEVTTTDLGVFDLVIGNGVALSGVFNSIDWAADSYWIKLDLDPDGGDDYINMGASQLLSVPYALYAQESGSGSGGNPSDELQNLIYDPATNVLTITDGNSVTLNGGGSGMPQTLSFDSNTNLLTISDGNSVELPAGDQGPQGPAGPQGETGPAGPQGEAGPQGPNGINGSAGPQGEPGPVGPQGPAGPAGTGINLLGSVPTVADLPPGASSGDLYIVEDSGDGYAWDGSSWNNVGAIQGPAGPQGEQGPQGETGAPGPEGPQGEQGTTGPQGPQGSAGTGINLLGTVPTVGDLPGSGMPGDLYIVATSGDGYAWDGSSWNNVGAIQGPTGPQGEQGPIGLNGLAGPQGPQGEQGPVGMTGPQGDQGPTGPTGPQGDQGIPGPEGPQGDQGPIGLSGPQGPQGEAGPIGPQGDQGPIGLTGLQGEAGPIGPQGLQGPQGDQGPAGPIGLQGPQGNQGPIGFTGPQGEQGPQGPQGPAGPAGEIELDYYDETNSPSSSAFHIHNISTNASFGLVGSTGSSSVPANRAGVMGYSTNAHGVYGRSENGFYAGVQGVSNSSSGYGVLGYGFGGGIGGYFYTTTTGQAALTTGNGNVGIGLQEPEMKMHVAGDMLLQSNIGAFHIGFPNNGNRWRLSTTNSGADLLFRSKPNASNTYSTRFAMRQSGEFQIGTSSTPSAWMHIRHNSTISKPQLKLEEVGNDYARLELTNTSAGGALWHVAGFPSTSAASARLNFYFRNASGAADRMTLTGDGELGINGVPTARVEIFQRSQSVGTGLRFDDGTANQDWDITHGFSLRFHYGGSLRGFINANTGAYTQSSDLRLKTNISGLHPVLSKVTELRPTTYSYRSDETGEMTVGFLAQEAQEVFPELVSYSTVDELYGINYAGFSVIAIKAIQEQQAIIEQQANEINELHSRLERIEALLKE